MSESRDPIVRTRVAHGVAAVTAATIAGNALAYLLLLTAAHLLRARDFASIVALLNVLLVASVPAFAVQAVAARRVATGQTQDLIKVSGVLAAGVGALFLLLTPIEVTFLHLPNPWAAVALALVVPGITIQGLCQGIWQGRQHFTGLSVTTLLGLFGRSGAGLLGLVLGGTAASTLGALAAGVVLSATFSAAGLRGRYPGPRAGGARPHRVSLFAQSSALLVECLRAAHAYGAFLLLSVTDLLLATHVLSERAAAGYAAGSVLTKVALWLPQSVASVLFASMTDHRQHRRLFLGAVSWLVGFGGLMAAATALLAAPATKAVGGNQYPQLEPVIWLFAALGSALAIIQFTLVTGLAIRDGRTTRIVWLTVVAEIGYVLVVDRHASVQSIVGGVLVLNTGAVVLALLQRTRRRGAQPAAAAGQGPGVNAGSKPGPNLDATPEATG